MWVKNRLSSPPCPVWPERGCFSCVWQLIALLLLDLPRPLRSATSAGDNLTQRALQVKKETAKSRDMTEANEQHVTSPW